MEHDYTKKVLIAVGIVAAATIIILFAGSAFSILLMVLAGALFSIFFRAIAAWLQQLLPVNRGIALTIAVVGVVAIIALTVFLLAPRIGRQVDEIKEKAPQGIAKIKDNMKSTEVGRFILEQVPSTREEAGLSGDKLRKRIAQVASSTFGVLGDAYVILFLGIFFLANPTIYRQAILALITKSYRERIGEVYDYSGEVLKKWMFGKLLSMAIVAVLTGVALWIIGIPFALTLALIAGLFSFVPNFGPLLALVPAVAVAITLGMSQVWYVVIAYMSVQALESNLITPFIQRTNVSLPFAVIILSQILLGLYTGLLGLILAVPLAALVILWVQMLYVHDVLGNKDVKLLGEK
jgi:predicted PurR-regulated permease PerM